VFVLSGAAGMALTALIETPPLFTETEAFPVYGANGAAKKRHGSSATGTTT